MNTVIFKYNLFETIPFNNTNEKKLKSAQLKIKQCIDQKMYETIPALIAAGAPKARDLETFLHRPTFAFLLDKCIETIPQIGKGCEFEGGHVASNAYLLLEALSKEYANLPHLEHYAQEDQLDLAATYKKLMLSLSFAIYWDGIEDVSHVVEDLKSCQGKVNLLVFSGYNEHAAHFCIEKDRFICFNKGAGNWRHHSRDNARQSFFSKNILGTIESPLLNNLVEAKMQSTIDYLYETADQLTNSQLDPPSSLEHDYSQGQLQGTCSAQALLAIVRYYLRRGVKGTDLHKQGIYKEHKARLLRSMFLDHSCCFHPTLSDLVEEKLELFRLDLNLLEKAKDPNQFQYLMNELKVDVVPICTTTPERYAFLRAQIKKNLNYKHPFSILLKKKREREDTYLQHLLEGCDDLEEREAFLRRIYATGSRYIRTLSQLNIG